MKKFTILDREGLMAFLAGVIGIVVMLSLTGCSSVGVTGCEGLVGVEKDECVRMKQAHEQMLRAGFYETGSANK